MKSPPSVLIVDDEAAIVMALEITLEASGFSVCSSASSKEEAVATAIKCHPDFVVMDIRLSGASDGIEAAKEIREKLGDTRIIFITGYSEGEVRRRAMEQEPIAYVVKPFQVSELIAIMNEHRN